MSERGWAIVLALYSCLLTTVVGIIVWQFQRRINKRDEKKDAQDAARVKYELMMIQLSMASLSLGEATAEAVQRIPDAHCNGDMHAALDAAKRIKVEYRNFEAEQIAKNMNR